jgi:hypothetical protein
MHIYICPHTQTHTSLTPVATSMVKFWQSQPVAMVYTGNHKTALDGHVVWTLSLTEYWRHEFEKFLKDSLFYKVWCRIADPQHSVLILTTLCTGRLTTGNISNVCLYFLMGYGCHRQTDSKTPWTFKQYLQHSYRHTVSWRAIFNSAKTHVKNTYFTFLWRRW